MSYWFYIFVENYLILSFYDLYRNDLFSLCIYTSCTTVVVLFLSVHFRVQLCFFFWVYAFVYNSVFFFYFLSVCFEYNWVPPLNSLSHLISFFYQFPTITQLYIFPITHFIGPIASPTSHSHSRPQSLARTYGQNLIQTLIRPANPTRQAVRDQQQRLILLLCLCLWATRSRRLCVLVCMFVSVICLGSLCLPCVCLTSPLSSSPSHCPSPPYPPCTTCQSHSDTVTSTLVLATSKDLRSLTTQAHVHTHQVLRGIKHAWVVVGVHACVGNYPTSYCYCLRPHRRRHCFHCLLSSCFPPSFSYT